MTEPRRVKVEGDLYHGKIPLDADGRPAVYVGRAAPGLPASPYANPFRVGEPVARGSELWPFLAEAFPGIIGPAVGAIGFSSVTLQRPEDAVAVYSAWFFQSPALLLNAQEHLGGKDLACWCKLPKRGEPDHCHAAWLLGMVAELEAGDG